MNSDDPMRRRFGFKSSWWRNAGTVGAGLALLSATPLGSARSAILALGEQPYPYVIVQQEIGAVLREFGANHGLKVNVSPEVRGRVTTRLPQLAPVAFLDRLAKLHDFEWYFDGSVLHISAVRESQTRFLALEQIGYERFRRSLDALRISDPRYDVHRDGDANVALVSGPPRYVAMVEQSLAALVADDRSRPIPTVVAGPVSRPAPPSRTPLLIIRGAQVQVLANGGLP